MRVRITRRDPELPHQLVVCFGQDGGTFAVSCLCLGAGRQGAIHEHFGIAHNLEMIWKVYDSGEHLGDDFTPGDRGKQEWVDVW